MIPYIVACVILILFSAFFSSVEIALTSLNQQLIDGAVAVQQLAHGVASDDDAAALVLTHAKRRGASLVAVLVFDVARGATRALRTAFVASAALGRCVGLALFISVFFVFHTVPSLSLR